MTVLLHFNDCFSMAYLVLFISAFGAATLLPFSSELTLLSLLSGDYFIVGLWAVATLGNTLGACVNWWLGQYFTRFQGRSWFPFNESQFTRGQRWFNRYGKWSLLLSWLPVVGDVLTLVAGTLRVKLPWFLPLVLIGKGARYMVVIALYFQFF